MIQITDDQFAYMARIDQDGQAIAASAVYGPLVEAGLVNRLGSTAVMLTPDGETVFQEEWGRRVGTVVTTTIPEAWRQRVERERQSWGRPRSRPRSPGPRA